MYHSIGTGLGRKHPYFETTTSPGLFARHMKFLRDNGYTTVDLNGVVEAVKAGGGKQKRIAITFDDGYQDFYTEAFPVLSENGFRATVFIVSGFVGTHRTRVGDKEYMTWKEVQEVHAHGIQIGSHTVSHSKLNGMSPREVECEIRQSKDTIEDKLDEPIRSFSCPFAFPEQDKQFVEMLRGFLEEHGYENGVSTIIGTAGPNHDPYFLPRLPVNSYDDLRFFQAKLDGGYDWLHTPQRFYKTHLRRGSPVARATYAGLGY
jgi:peptidoglycan/xylan/chitin deacetylase (PgdA/CDA1 family)